MERSLGAIYSSSSGYIYSPSTYISTYYYVPTYYSASYVSLSSSNYGYYYYNGSYIYNPVGKIVGAVVGSLVFVIILTILICLHSRVWRRLQGLMNSYNVI